MATTYEICLALENAVEEEWFNIADLGLSAPERVCGLAHVDTLTLTAAGMTAFTDDTLLAPGALARFSRVADGIRTLLFLGRVQPHLRTCAPSESFTVELRGMWDWFEDTVMLQSWTDADDITRAAPRAVLFWSDGSRLTTGQQIERCVGRARAGGCPCAAPAPGDIDAGWSPPSDEQVNISVADAVLKALANHPHASCWFDYSGRSPRLYVRTRQSLPAVTADIVGHTGISVRSREDLQPPAIAICFQKPFADGERQGMSTIVDYAPVIPGETDDARNARLSQSGALWAVYDLAGMTAQYQQMEQSLETEPIDWSTNILSPTWWARWCPMLNDENISSVTLSNPDYTGSGGMPNILLNGAAQKWMGVQCEKEAFSVDTLIVTGNSMLPLEIRTERLTAEFTTTDGHTKTYRKKDLTSYDSGESVPEGLAAQMWDEWQQLHHEGSVAVAEEEPSLQLRPGIALNLSGGRAEWMSMAAMVCRVTERFETGETVAEFGVPGWVDIDSRVAWYRNCRGRRYSMTREMGEPQDQGGVEETDEGDAGITGLPSSRDGGNASHIIRRVFDNPAAAVAHRVDIYANADLMGFEFATASDGQTARNVRVLEVLVPVASGGKVIGAKRAQVLACQPYGDTVPLDAPDGGGWGEAEIPPPPGPVDFESVLWLDGEPVIDLNSGALQDAGVRLSAVLPLDTITHYPCKFIAARFFAPAVPSASLGVVRRPEDAETDPLKVSLDGVDSVPEHKDTQRVFGFASNDKWGLYEMESLFKLDGANKRIYMDLAGYTNFKTLLADSDTFAFNADANLAGKNGAEFDVVVDVSWDSETNKLVVKKRTVTLFKFGLKAVTAATPVESEIETDGLVDLRYDLSSHQLQKQTENGGAWTMINGGQFSEETL